MKLVDLLRPWVADGEAEVGRPDGIISHLGMTIRMPVNPTAEMVRQHLRAETNAEKRLLLSQWDLEPIDLPADEIIGVIRAHRSPEDDRTGVPGHACWQGITQAWTAHIERIAALA